MAAIRELQAEGYEVSLNGEDIKCRKLEGANPNSTKVQHLLKEIKDRKAEAIHFLRKHYSYDRQIQAVIAELNFQGIRMSDVPEPMRKKALFLEERMTRAANTDRREEFETLLHQWRRCFH